jgi:hypothetical protein
MFPNQILRKVVGVRTSCQRGQAESIFQLPF